MEFNFAQMKGYKDICKIVKIINYFKQKNPGWFKHKTNFNGICQKTFFL